MFHVLAQAIAQPVHGCLAPDELNSCNLAQPINSPGPDNAFNDIAKDNTLRRAGT